MVHRRLGNCIACHQVTKILQRAKDDDLASLRRYGFHGKIAPTLDGVAERYTEAELRMSGSPGLSLKLVWCPGSCSSSQSGSAL